MRPSAQPSAVIENTLCHCAAWIAVGRCTVWSLTASAPARRMKDPHRLMKTLIVIVGEFGQRLTAKIWRTCPDRRREALFHDNLSFRSAVAQLLAGANVRGAAACLSKSRSNN